MIARDEVDAKKKRTSDPMHKMNTYVDQSIKVRKLKHGSSDDVSTFLWMTFVWMLTVESAFYRPWDGKMSVSFRAE